MNTTTAPPPAETETVDIPSYHNLSPLWRLWYRIVRPIMAVRKLILSPRVEGGYRVAEFYEWPDSTVQILRKGTVENYDQIGTKARRVIFEGGVTMGGEN